MKRSRLLLILIPIGAVSLCASLWIGHGPLWWLVMTETRQTGWSKFGRDALRGSSTWLRWGEENLLHAEEWYVENGRKASQLERTGIPREYLETEWHQDGTILVQRRIRFNGTWFQTKTKKEAAPWWGTVGPQTEPTAPWWGKE